jgi:polyisoprenoid-binding protein YceI
VAADAWRYRRPIEAGTYKLGPDDATLRVRTARKGAAAKAGHDLVIEVTSWSATLTLTDDPAQSALELDAEPASLKVRQGTGGVMELGDDDRREIEQNIVDEVLGRHQIEFRSNSIEGAGERLAVGGDLTLAGRSQPVSFELGLAPDGRLSGSATVNQTDWQIKPYTALFGTLKVADEVRVEVEGRAGG